MEAMLVKENFILLGNSNLRPSLIRGLKSLWVISTHQFTYRIHLENSLKASKDYYFKVVLEPVGFPLNTST